MKIDMSPAAITLRLKQVEQLRQACLALAGSGFALEIRQKFSRDFMSERSQPDLEKRESI